MANQANAPAATPAQQRDLSAHVARIGKQDKIATGILTAIVGFVLLLLAAIIVYILARGGGIALTPGFLTNPSTDEAVSGILYQLFDSFYMLLITLLISVPISLGGAIFLVEYAPDTGSPPRHPRPSRRFPACPPSSWACSVRFSSLW